MAVPSQPSDILNTPGNQPNALIVPTAGNMAHRFLSANTSLTSARSGSQTLTETSGEADTRSPSPEPLVLRLRGAHDPTDDNRRRRIQWAEDVVDNEGMGRKKSKVCCIFHPHKEVGESSDESSDSSTTDSDASGEDDDGRARLGGKGKRRRRKPGHEHDHNHDDNACGHDHKPTRPDRRGRLPSPNAYERVPKYRGKKDNEVTRKG